jgi:hypothetical protein
VKLRLQTTIERHAQSLLAAFARWILRISLLQHRQQPWFMRLHLCVNDIDLWNESGESGLIREGVAGLEGKRDQTVTFALHFHSARLLDGKAMSFVDRELRLGVDARQFPLTLERPRGRMIGWVRGVLWSGD